jgi:hypothetical protein
MASHICRLWLRSADESPARAVQLCSHLDIDIQTEEGIRICNAAYFLKDLI